MIIRFILVGIEGSLNLGLIARTCMNFNIDELYIVDSKVDLGEAYRYAANASCYLSRAVFTNSLDIAIDNCELVVATSALGYSSGDIVRQAVSIEEFISIAERVSGRLAVLFGRESSGLTREEISRADFLLTIPASPDYPILNISQAVAVIAWELWKLKKIKPSNIPPRASREEIDYLIEIIRSVSSDLFTTRDKVNRLLTIWRRLVYRSYPSKYECKLLEYWFRKLHSRLKRARNN